MKFLKLHQDTEVTMQRQNIVNMKYTDSKARQIITEISSAKNYVFIKGACVYAWRSYANQLSRDITYQDINLVIFLAILDFKLFLNKKDFLSHHKLKDVCMEECDIEEFSFLLLKLKKIQKTFDESINMVEKLSYFLGFPKQQSLKSWKK